MVYIVFNNSSKNAYYSGYDFPTIAYISNNKQKCIDYLAKKKAEHLSCNSDAKIEIDKEDTFGIDCGKWYYEMYIEEYEYEVEIN